MTYNAAGNKYEPGTEGLTVGCYHIQLGGGCTTYNDALAALGGNPAGFVKYLERRVFTP